VWEWAAPPPPTTPPLRGLGSLSLTAPPPLPIGDALVDVVVGAAVLLVDALQDGEVGLVGAQGEKRGHCGAEGNGGRRGGKKEEGGRRGKERRGRRQGGGEEEDGTGGWG